MFILVLLPFLISQDLSLYLPDSYEGYKMYGDTEKHVDPTNNCNQIIKNYQKGKSELTITLMDYRNAPQIYNSTVDVWTKSNEVNNESIRAGRLKVRGFNGWQSIRKEEKASEVIVAVNGRYIVTFQCMNSPLNEAKKMAFSYNYHWLKK